MKQTKKSFPSCRIKALDLHPSKNLLLVCLYSGTVQIRDTTSLAIVKSIILTDKPIRAGIFVDAHDIILVGDDNGFISILSNFAVRNKFVAHGDFVRRIKYKDNTIYTCSDDCTIKAFEMDGTLKNSFEGHKMYVMDFIVGNELISVSLDRTIKIWSLSGRMIKSITAHVNGINCIEFFQDGFVTGSDDLTIKNWAYGVNGISNTPISTVNAHLGNINRLVRFGDRMFSLSEDSYLKEWSNNFTLENKYNLGSRVWDLKFNAEKIFVATDEELVVFYRTNTIFSICSRNRLIYVVDNKLMHHRVNEDVARDGLNLVGNECLSMKKEITLEFIPDGISISPSGKLVALVDEKNVSIYSLLGFRLKLTQPGSKLIFLNDSDFIVNNGNSVLFYRNYEIYNELEFPAEDIFYIKGGCNIETLGNVDFTNDLIIMVVDNRTKIVDFRGDVLDTLMIKPKAVAKIGSNLIFIFEEKIQIFSDHEIFEKSIKIDDFIFEERVVMISSNGKVYCVILESLIVMYFVCEIVGKLVGVFGDVLYYLDGDIMSLQFDNKFLNWQQKAINGDYGNLEGISKNKAVEFLISIQKYEAALEYCEDINLKFEIFVKLGRLEEALEFATEGYKLNMLAKAFISKKQYSLASDCFFKSGDFANAYILDFDGQNLESVGNNSTLNFFKCYEAGKFAECVKFLGNEAFAELFTQHYL